MKRLAGGGRGKGCGRRRGRPREPVAEVIGSEPSATNAASLGTNPLPIYVVFRNSTGKVGQLVAFQCLFKSSISISRCGIQNTLELMMCTYKHKHVLISRSRYKFTLITFVW